MREIFVNQDYTKVGHYKSILESASIPCYIRNGVSHSLLTELPSPIFFPTLCVENDEDYDRALELLKTIHKPTKSEGPDWKCNGCGETVPGTFDSCWSCGHELVETKTPLTAVETAAQKPDIVQPATYYTSAVNRLRMMIFITAAIEIGFYIAQDSAFLKLEIYPRNAMSGLYDAFSIFATPVFLLSLVLCFFLVPIGRTLLLISIAASFLLYHGSTGGILHREYSSIFWLSDLLRGAILAMIFFSPVSVYFEKKRTETGVATPKNSGEAL